MSCFLDAADFGGKRKFAALAIQFTLRNGSGRLHHLTGHLPGLVELGPAAPASCGIILTNAFSQSSITEHLQSIGG